MDTRLNPYVSFRDEARAAIEFYQSVFGGEVTISTFGEMGASEDPAEADKVMHSMLETENGFVIMASDLPNSMDLVPGTNFAISISGDNDAEIRRYWDGLVNGGTVTQPLETAPWGDAFGMCVDKFGVDWLVNISAPGSDA